MEKTPLERFLITAKKAGSPKDQVENFLKASYVPLPWQWKFHALARKADQKDGPVDIGVGGARGPGKSHAVMAQAALDDCQRTPGLKGLFLRQTGLAARESFDDLILKVVAGRTKYERLTNTLKFPNGSRIILGGFRTASDIDKYIGIEYDFMIVEELNQLTDDKYTKLRGSLRTSRADWRPRIYTSFNPGGIGHVLVYYRYLRERPQNVAFVKATYKENPFLNEEYIEYLENLPGPLGRAWREGDFDQFEGQFFKEWRSALHTVKPFIPLDNLPKYAGFDWGFSPRPSVFLAGVIQKIPWEGLTFNRLWIYKEIWAKETYPQDFAKFIKTQVKLDQFQFMMADPSINIKQSDGSRSIRDQFIESDVRFLPANNDRVNGWMAVRNWLSIAPDELPYMMISENCINLIKNIPVLVHDENNKDDLDTDGPDDEADALRYMCIHLKWIDAKAGAIKQKKERKVKKPMIDKVDFDAFATIKKSKRTYKPV